MLMKRTQVYIDIPTYQKAQTLARMRRKTLSQIVRDSLDKSLKEERSEKYNSLELIAELSKKIKLPKNTPRDLSTNLDKYLYRLNEKSSNR